MRVFLSHAYPDKPLVGQLAQALTARGFEVWFDKWAIAPGDDLVARINEGLETADAGLICFSEHTADRNWVQAEVSYLTWARIEERKLVIPVIIGDKPVIPALLRPLARRGIEEIDAIADALRNRRPGPPPVGNPAAGSTVRATIALDRVGTSGVKVTVRIGDVRYAGTELAGLPADLLRGRDEFLKGFRTGLRRSPAEGERAGLETELRQLGHALRKLCLPEDSADALTTLIQGAPVGTLVVVLFQSDDPELLGLPFEALRLADDRLMATVENVITFRAPATATPLWGGSAAPSKQTPEPLAGPIKVLIAVGAPDEGQTASVVLDHERELQNILNAVEAAQKSDNFQVRILEVGHPDVIQTALQRDPYHVLHLSCHGGPGVLELEDEEGRAVPTTPRELLARLVASGRPVPLIFLNSCHGGVSADTTASFSVELLRRGVPAVVAMQTSVSDHYATQLAEAFYGQLANHEPPLASRALAAARKQVEQARHKAIQQGATLAETQPEYATAALYLEGTEQPVADLARDRQPLTRPPVYAVSGPVPQLRIDDLIGRRANLRHTLQTLRDVKKPKSGVVLTGLGGVGKSAVAGRVMQRMKEEGWLIAAHGGRFDVRGIALAVAGALLDVKTAAHIETANYLQAEATNDIDRLREMAKVLTAEPLLLVLDDFEQNLSTGGLELLDPDVAVYLKLLAESALRGKLLLTCRYPLASAQGLQQVAVRLKEEPLGPLSPAETRKLMQRLPGLRQHDSTAVVRVVRGIGGHPRMLEFLDALVRQGEGRLDHVTLKLNEIAKQAGIDPNAEPAPLEEQAARAISLGMRDVLLEELVEVARQEGHADVLFQTAVSNLPVTAEGVAHMLSGEPAEGAEVAKSFRRLAELSLVTRLPGGEGWVHRWTAQGLARVEGAEISAARCVAAAKYRWWRVTNESHDFEDAREALRNFLTGGEFDEATQLALALIQLLEQRNQSVGIAALAGEVLETLPVEHENYAQIIDAEARAHLALGFTDRALERYRRILEFHRQRVAAEPERADYQRDLSVSYNKMGDLYRSLGDGAGAREAYGKSLAIRERLAAGEPVRADYLRDLSVSYERMGDLYRALGDGAGASEAYGKSLAIAERLAAGEPERADYQRDLSVSYNKMGDLYDALGDGAGAREFYEKDLAIAERLAAGEPERADYQRDLSVSYDRMGDLYSELGDGARAREAYGKSLAIRERLAAGEPERADYRRDLSVSYDKMGNLYRELGDGAGAREAFGKSLAIRERLAAGELERADYQRDLSVSYNKMGDLYRGLGDGLGAREAYGKSLAIAERLAAGEPERADYQIDLVISLYKIATSEEPPDRPPLERGLAILLSLQQTGRLSPEHESKIEGIRELLK